MKTFASLFTGCGGADDGAIAAGLTSAWGIEKNAKFAALARLGGHASVKVGDVNDHAFGDLPSPDWLHASPPCQSASIANVQGKESSEDLHLAQSICRFLSKMKPQVFSLENVCGYAKYASFEKITQTLNSLGYKCSLASLNSANYGVPQTRVRLVLVATLLGQPSIPWPTHEKPSNQISFFPACTWKGWGDEVQRTLNFLPLSESAMSDRLKTKAIEIARQHPEKSGMIVGFKNEGFERSLTVRLLDQPASTVMASMDRPSTLPWAFRWECDSLRVAMVDVPQLALLQSFHKDRLWGDDIVSARKSIGNAVPPLLMKTIISENLK